MADSKVEGPEEAPPGAEEAAKRKALASKNEIVIGQVGDPNPLESSAVTTNPNPHLFNIEVKSGSLGTGPDLAHGDPDLAKRGRSVSPYVTPPSPLKPGNSAVIATAGQAPKVGAPSTLPSQTPARPRPKPPLSPRSSASFFGSCFGGTPATSSSGKLPSPKVSPRKQPSPPIRRVPPDPQKAGAPPTEDEKKALAQDSTSNKAAAPPAVVVTAPSETAPVIARSPSCRCSISTAQGEIAGRTEQSLPLEPGATGGDQASMNKEDNDPGISSGQQVLNAQAEELIGAVKRTDEESRQAATGVSPIRGLRPNTQIRTKGRRRRNDLGEGDGTAVPRGRERRPFEGRSRSPHNYNHNPSGSYYNPPPRDPSPEPQATAIGIERLFDAIIGRGEFLRQSEQDRPSRSPNRFRKLRRLRDSGSSTSAWIEQIPSEQHPGDDGQLQIPRDPTPSNPAEPSSSRDQAYFSPTNLPETSSSRDRDYNDLANFKEKNKREKYEKPSEQTGTRDQVNQSGTYVDARAALDVHLDQRGANLLASEYRWKKKDPYREVVWRTTPKEPRRRGYPDPSFNPRPGDIIIRARKRAGLRLTDFYYYDNENYMEQGDQILRAKFEYLPPMDMMYLWCRLYVYGADGTYTYLDSTSEKVGKFRTEPDVKTFREPFL